MHLPRALVLGAASLLASLTALADVVETRDGARLVGTIQAIDGGHVILATSYAGELKIKLADVTGLQSEREVFVRLQSGTTVAGRLEGTRGELRVVGSDATLSSSVDKVTQGWRPGSVDPREAARQAEVEANRRSWAYQATVDIAGKSGNTKEFGSRLAFSATLQSPQDALRFYASYDRSERNGVTTADEIKGGVDYSNRFSKRLGWYVNTELEKDTAETIDLRSTSAFGLSYLMIDRGDQQQLTGRAGLSFLYEDYSTGVQNEDLGLDFALLHNWRFADWGRMTNSLRFVPTLEDFGSYRIAHDSGVEIPLGGTFWLLRLGISHQYNTEAAAGREKLDTSYYTRLVLNWK